MRGWSVFFALAAAFNLVIGLIVMVAPASFAGAAGSSPLELLSPRIIGWFIFVFGIGYAITATAPARHEGLVQIGLIGKLGFVAMMAIAFWSEVVTIAQFLPALGDLPLAAAFCVFLAQRRGTP